MAYCEHGVEMVELRWNFIVARLVVEVEICHHSRYNPLILSIVLFFNFVGEICCDHMTIFRFLCTCLFCEEYREYNVGVNDVIPLLRPCTNGQSLV